MAKLPAFWLYPGDWMKDAELRLCSIFARGLLVDLLCLMFEAKHRGRLVLADGNTPWTDEQIVDSVTGGDREQKLEALNQLLMAGVLKRDSQGIIYSARLLRDEELRVERSKAGSKGGSKTQAKRKANAKAKSNLSISSSSSISSSEINTPPAAGECESGSDFERFWETYPRKVAKGNAVKAFSKALKRTDCETIIKGAGRYAVEVTGKEERYIAHPASWLNADRWEDQPAETSTTSGLSPATEAWDAILRAIPRLPYHGPQMPALVAAVGEHAAEAAKAVGVKAIAQADEFKLRELRKRFDVEFAKGGV